LTIPPAVYAALDRGESVFPLGPDKKPVVPSWKPLQERQPTIAEVKQWARRSPSSWATVTGARSGVVILDFDGEQGCGWLRRFGLEPHIRTGSGGFHVRFRHPGWRVKTLNSKSKIELGERWPGLDIRADGGYAAFHGRNESGPYAELRDPGQLEPLDKLPDDLRKFLGLWEPPPPEAVASNGAGRASDDDERVAESVLIERAIREAALSGRNNAGFWLACQLRDNGYTQPEAERAVLDYRGRAGETNTKGTIEPYAEGDVIASVREAYNRSPREPWKLEPDEGAAESHSEETPEGQAPVPFALSLPEFIATKTDTPPALIGDEDENLLPATGLALLAGKGGKGKTTFVVEGAFHLASGIDWHGFRVERPLRILFIENEGAREPFRCKLELKAQSWEHEIKGAIYVYSENWGAARLDDDGFVDRLNQFVEENEIDLVIGDPLDTLGMEGVGSPEDTRNMVARLQKAGLFSRVAWWILHHSRKEGADDAIDEVSGAWGGKPDSLLLLEKMPGNRAKLRFPKIRWSRRGEKAAFILAFDPETESFVVVHEETEDERDYVAEVERLLKKTPSRTTGEISAPVEKGGIGAKHDTVKKLLGENPGRFISRNGSEVGRSPRATCWDLVELFPGSETVETVGVPLGTERGTVSTVPTLKGTVVPETVPVHLRGTVSVSGDNWETPPPSEPPVAKPEHVPATPEDEAELERVRAKFGAEGAT
jgi:hypothetical protein